MILGRMAGAALLSLCAVAAAFGQSPDSAGDSLALVGGMVYVSPAEEPLHDGVVLIRGEMIVAVGSRAAVPLPEGTRTIDCSGLAVTAGFWNSHIHFFERKWVNAESIPAPELGRQIQDMVTRYGWTSVFDIGSKWDNTRRLRDRIESGEVPGPRIRSTGEALVAPGAVPPDRVLGMLGYMSSPSPEVSDAAQAVQATKQLLGKGVDGIKLHLQPPPAPNPPFPADAIPAAVEEAHRAGKPVFLHPGSGADILAAARAGVDVVAHTTPRTGPWDETILKTTKDRRVALTPTLSIWRQLMRHDRISAQQEQVDAAIGQLRAWVGAGGTVLFGNDLGAVDYDPSEEYVLMSRAGMSFRQILASLTTAPAERFGESKRLGRIARGFKADLVVLKDDPARDIRALAAVKYTLRAGKVVFQAD